MARPEAASAARRAMAALLVTILSVSCQKAPDASTPPVAAPPADVQAEAPPADIVPTDTVSTDIAPEPAAPVEGELVLDEWTLIMMSGQPAGRASLRVVRKGEEFLTSLEQSFQMSRMGVVIKAGTTATVREGVDGSLVGFEMDMDVAANSITIEGRVEGAKLVLTSRTMGQERSKELDWPEGALFGYAEERFVRSQKLTPGAKFSYWTYVPDLEKIAEITYEVGEVEEIDVLGRKVRATRLVKKGAAVPIVEYRDSDGVAWKMQMSMAGISMEMLRTSREVALERTTTPGTFDVLADLAVRVAAEIEHPRAVTRATYRLRLSDDSLDDLTLDGPGQRATREADGTVLLEVKAVAPSKSSPLGETSGLADKKKYLAASTFVQSDDPAVVRVARRETVGARSSLEAAKRLERWVARNLGNKGFGTGFATASEVMQNRAGDCSEHSVLLCALLRAAGIPSRGATGLVYVDFPEGPAFWYHMWSEAWVGEWVPLDAVFPARYVDAAHIRLAEMDLAGMTPGSDALKLIRVFGQLEICVIEYASRGRTYEVGPRTEFKGGRYRDLDEGVSFAPPEGWDLVRAGDSRLKSKGAVAALAERKGEGRIVLVSTPVAGGKTLGDIVDGMARRNAVTDRRKATLGGADAVRVRYKSPRGEAREGVAAVRGGRFYLLRLEPATPPGVRALEAVARSFRFE